MSASYDWSRFTVRINVNAPVPELYRAWATRAGMERWFLRLSEYKRTDHVLRGDSELAEKGDSYKWRWYGWPDETTEYGEILDCNGKDLFKFSFSNAGNCTVKIYTEHDETIVELLQENIPADDNGKHTWHLGCKTGWTFYMTNLKSLYEGGTDLRNKNVLMKNVLNS